MRHRSVSPSAVAIGSLRAAVCFRGRNGFVSLFRSVASFPVTPVLDFLVRLLFSTGRKRIFKEEGKTGWDGTLHAENYVRLSAPSREPLDETVHKDSSQLATRKSSERAGKPAEEDARCHSRHLNTWNVDSKF